MGNPLMLRHAQHRSAWLVLAFVSAIMWAWPAMSAAQWSATTGIAGDTRMETFNPFGTAYFHALSDSKGRFRLIANWDTLCAPATATNPCPAGSPRNSDEANRVHNLITGAANAGAEVMVSLRIPGTPPSAAAYGVGVDMLRVRYPQISYWGALNEPNLVSFGSVTLATKAARTADYYWAVVGAVGSNKVIGPEWVDNWSRSYPNISASDVPTTVIRDWVAAYRSAGGGFGVAAGFHPYGGISRRKLDSLNQYMDALPAGTNVWLPEAGALRVRQGVQVTVDGAAVTDSLQSSQVDYLLRTMAIAQRNSGRVTRTYYYQLPGHDTGWDTGLLNHPSGAPRPAWYTWCTYTCRPAAETGSASSVNHTSASVSGTVTPNHRPTSVRIEYGPTTAYGQSVTLASVDGGATVPVTASLTGLTAATTYHYRVVAEHIYCAPACPRAAYGTDRTFSTLADPRIAVIQSDGTLWTKDGPLSTAWVRQTSPEIKQVALAGNRIAAIKTDGSVWTKEGSPWAVWVKQTDPDFKQVVLDGDRLAAVETNGTLWTKEGSLTNSSWVRQTNAEVAQVVMDGGRIAVRKTDGTIWTKEGSLANAWVKQTDPSFKQVALEGDRLAAVETNGTLWTKEGSLANAWVRQTDAEVKYVTMEDTRIALVKTDGSVWTKDGSLGNSWVAQSDGGMNHVLLESGRLAAVETNGTLWTKNTFTSSWVRQTDPEVLQTPEGVQVSMEGDRVALVKTDGTVWTKEGSLANPWVRQTDPTFKSVLLSPYP